ncbi:hypothetical protein JG687_00014346 [Phytophthora cactorum]|uniref:Uncharacterized protein n=1 Tax=Phytophthora cactorum TaxID=29920 RepID=A0A8T1U1V5_9STRA|nr:hypothetical protein JG687_00014346 [Phytophthora cactorum]
MYPVLLATWNLALGAITNAIRSRSAYSTRVAASIKKQFCLTSFVERDWTKNSLPSLTTYSQEFGDCLVGRLFIVPSQFPWPEKAKQPTRDEEILNSLEFVWEVDGFMWTKRIVPALKFTEPRMDIRVNYVVPSHDPWSKKALGM